MNGTPAELLPRSPRQLPLHHSRDKENSKERASLDRHSASSRLEALETEYAVLNNKYATLLQETTASASSIQNLELENKTLRAEIDALLKEQRALIRTNTDVNDQLEEEVSSRDKTLENWRIKEQTLANTIKIQKSEIKDLKFQLKGAVAPQKDGEMTGTRIYIEELKLANKQAEAQIAMLNHQVLQLQESIKELSHDLFSNQQMLGGMQEQYNQLEFESKQIFEERNQLCVEVQHYEMLLQEQGQKYNKFSKELTSEQEGGPHEQGRAVKMSCERKEEHRNSLANEIEDADAAPSDNEALREEIVGLTQYINKLIQQINDAGLEQERRIDSSVVIPTAKRWTLGLRSFSGGKAASKSELPWVPVLEPIVFDHKEWTAKQALVTRRNELGADAETLTLSHDNAEIPKRNTVLGSLSKTLGSWYSSPANRKNPDADENLPLGVIYKDSKPDFSSKITVAEITPQFHEIQKLERALPKIGYRQSRILENKRAIQY